MTPDALVEALQGYTETLRDGTVFYYNAQGQLHRTHGPAVIYPSGAERWYQWGKLHRIDGPAVIRADGDEYWYQNDQLHRTDGPAVVRADGTKAWYVRGSFMTYTLFQHLATLGNFHDA